MLERLCWKQGLELARLSDAERSLLCTRKFWLALSMFVSQVLIVAVYALALRLTHNLTDCMSEIKSVSIDKVVLLEQGYCMWVRLLYAVVRKLRRCKLPGHSKLAFLVACSQVHADCLFTSFAAADFLRSALSQGYTLISGRRHFDIA